MVSKNSCPTLAKFTIALLYGILLSLILVLCSIITLAITLVHYVIFTCFCLVKSIMVDSSRMLHQFIYNLSNLL